MNLYPSGFRIAGRYEVAGAPLLGGMGIVYLCFDHQEQRPVALKTFRPEFLPDRATRDRFLQEGETWVRLGRHPHGEGGQESQVRGPVICARSSNCPPSRFGVYLR
jgi:serine/threonine protein kinase